MTVTELRPGGETETYAEGMARAAQMEAETEAARIKNEGERARQELAQQKAAAKAQADIEASLAEAAQARVERENRARDEAELRKRREKSAEDWKRAAKAIAIASGAVSLPLQVMAFMSASMILIPAPFVLEGVAWALLRGAAAAIDDDRPSWHYRLAALFQACIAAVINFLHGSATFGLGVGLGGALCSLIGPAIWDLHEHGRIAKREGRVPRKVRRADARAARVEERRVKKVNEARAQQDKPVWERAEYLAAALGEVVPSEKTYRRAWDEIHGAEVGSKAETIAARRAARHAVRIASNGPLGKTEKEANAQVDSQMDPLPEDAPQRPRKSAADGRKGNGGTPPRRVPGDVQYSPLAKNQMSHAARAASTAQEVSPS